MPKDSPGTATSLKPGAAWKQNAKRALALAARRRRMSRVPVLPLQWRPSRAVRVGAGTSTCRPHARRRIHPSTLTVAAGRRRPHRAAIPHEIYGEPRFWGEVINLTRAWARAGFTLSWPRARARVERGRPRAQRVRPPLWQRGAF